MFAGSTSLLLFGPLGASGSNPVALVVGVPCLHRAAVFVAGAAAAATHTPGGLAAVFVPGAAAAGVVAEDA